MSKIPVELLPGKIIGIEFAIRRYFVSAAPGTKVEHLLDPAYWQHAAQKLHLNDEIRVVAADGSFDVELTVTAVDPQSSRVRTALQRERKSDVAATGFAGVWPDADGYIVEFSGPHCWRIADPTGNVVDTGFADEAAAIVRLAEIKAKKAA